MSRENVEIVERAFEALGRGDWQGITTMLDPNVEVHDFDIPDAGIYHGQEGFLAWLTRWSEGWESWRVEDVDIRAVSNDQVIALFRMITKGAGSGIEMKRLDAIVYRLKDNKMTRLEYFNDQAQALEAVGPRGVGDVAGKLGDRAADV